jgi:hypothetical protein
VRNRYVVIKISSIGPQSSRFREGIERFVNPVIASASGSHIHPMHGFGRLYVRHLEVRLFRLPVLGLGMQRKPEGAQRLWMERIDRKRASRGNLRLRRLVLIQVLDRPCNQAVGGVWLSRPRHVYCTSQMKKAARLLARPRSLANYNLRAFA